MSQTVVHPSSTATQAATDLLLRLRLINACEQQRCLDLFAEHFPFSAAMASCESLHIHVKVDDTSDLPADQLDAAGCKLDYAKEGFVKYHFPGGVNLIFSSIVIAQDELAESCENRRQRPFVDHIGIDLRDESASTKATFQQVPVIASRLGWEEVPQGQEGTGVHCCHVEVSEKHWVFPCGDAAQPHIPMEFAFGKLKVNDVAGGCDIRPMSPSRLASMGDAAPTCDQ
ncbi:hypothetical protein [Neorhodopirellula lusitana]|uniref:hypothetical protein n=1 Tax=Neorhodopirellula lusitana TaxID=445327 RepID=UPI003850C15B